jgi:GTP cyclohydrolase II
MRCFLKTTEVHRLTQARLPIREGEFRMALYQDPSDRAKEHIALIFGNVADREGVLTRVHSECFTGDVLGSLRCDCGEQLESALQLVGEAGAGVLLYLRQEGRGIGLLEKLKAYNLQDRGFDTVDANVELGHQPDARDYAVAALILQDLEVRSVDLITNNPAKISGLESYGVPVRQRVPLAVSPTDHSAEYLNTKVERMNHLISLDMLRNVVKVGNGSNGSNGAERRHDPSAWLDSLELPADRPLVTISFAQSLDGSIALHRKAPLAISGPESQEMTHRLRRWHDGIMVGINTLLADNPRLTVRLVDGPSPRPIVADTRLRFPASARLLENPNSVLIGTGPRHDVERRKELEDRNVEILEIPEDPNGGIDLKVFLRELKENGIDRLMVEGGARIICSFLRCRLADAAVVTVSPRWVGGLQSISQDGEALAMPQFTQPIWHNFGDDMVMWAGLEWGQ